MVNDVLYYAVLRIVLLEDGTTSICVIDAHLTQGDAMELIMDCAGWGEEG